MTLRAPEPLTDAHAIDGFDSGVPVLNDWLKKRARANQVSGATRTFVVSDSQGVAAYYSLATGSITVVQATGRFRRNMPDPVPVIVLARLAVAKAHHGKGMGRGLVKDCAKRVLAAADQVGIRGLIVHAISDEAKAFYEAVGFKSSPTSPMTLMVTMDEVRQGLV